MELSDFKPKYHLNVYESEARAICKWDGILADWRAQSAWELRTSVDHTTVHLYIYKRLTDQQLMRLKLYLGFDIGEPSEV